MVLHGQHLTKLNYALKVALKAECQFLLKLTDIILTHTEPPESCAKKKVIKDDRFMCLAVHSYNP